MMRRSCVGSVAILFVFGTVYLAGQTEKFIAVTIDDLPLNIAAQVSNQEMRKIVSRLIAAITAEKTPVTAFVNENKLERKGSVDPERIAILKQWVDAGIDLGNHTYAHKSQNRISVAEAKEDILKGEPVTKKLLAAAGKQMRYFRHPFLQTGRDSATRSSIAHFLDSLGYTVAPVTVDNGEWIFAAAYDKSLAKNDSSACVRVGTEYLRYMKEKIQYYEWMSAELFGRQIKQILLIHSNRLNAEYYSTLIEMIRNEGYSFIALDETLRDSAYRSRDEFFGAGGISWLDRWALTNGKRGAFFSADPRVPKEIMDIAGVDSE